MLVVCIALPHLQTWCIPGDEITVRGIRLGTARGKWEAYRSFYLAHNFRWAWEQPERE